MKKTVEERFWEKVEKTEGGCWVWRGRVDKRGYGGFDAYNTSVQAHRFSFELVNGNLAGADLKSTCGIRACVNPSHYVLAKNGRGEGFPAEDRFWAKVEKTDTCWNWTAYIRPDGYGIFRPLNKLMFAHRYAYQLLKAPLTPGLVLDHLCRNRKCVNPDHLEEVTGQTNCLRGVSPSAIHAKKTQCPRGHLYSKENTIYLKSGSRWCKTCQKSRSKRVAKTAKYPYTLK